MKTVLFVIDGMTCLQCVKTIESALKSLGIDNYLVQIGSVSVTFDENLLDEETIKSAIEEEGYRVISSEVEFNNLDELF